MRSARELSDVIVAELVRCGADRVFGMPGGGNNLDFIGAAESAGMTFVLGHHETSVAIMATVYGDVSGQPGVCLVTRGPGAANTVNGVANALLDRQALVVVTDAVSVAERDRVAHQRLDQRALFSPVTKASMTVGGLGDGAQDGVASALRSALTPPLGPVHLDFDPQATTTRPTVPGLPNLDEGALAAARRLVSEARRPVVVLGVGARRHADVVRQLVYAWGVPVLTTYRAKGVVSHEAPVDAGVCTGATMEAPLLHDADLIVTIGVDSVELIPAPWSYQAPVLSLAEWRETSPYFVPALEVVGDVPALVTGMRDLELSAQWPADEGNRRRDAEIARMRGAGRLTGAAPRALAPQQVVDAVRAALPKGTTATVDAGAHMFPATTLWSVDDPEDLLISSGLATMGFALPAAIGAAYARPGHRVVCFTGDGGLGMCLGELETLARSALPVTVIVFNDALLSLIAIKAKPEGHGGQGAVAFAGVDFAAVARGFGIPSAVVTTPGELAAALEQAVAIDGPFVVDARVDPSGYRDIMNVVRGPR